MARGPLLAHAVFVHGLGGHHQHTWSFREKENVVTWPAWLSEDVPGLATWSVAYDAAVSRWRGSAMHLPDRATNVLYVLLAEPQLLEGEVILIGHSLGGLVIKQLIRTAESASQHDENVANFLRRVRRVAFLATPHTGSHLATWADRFRIFIWPSRATASLVRRDPMLGDLNNWYREWSLAAQVRHLILTETHRTGLAGRVVDADSGDPGLATRVISVDANHIDICKPTHRSSEVYVLIRKFVALPSESISTTLKKFTDPREQAASLEHLIRGTRDLKKFLDLLGSVYAESKTPDISDEGTLPSVSALRTPVNLIDREIRQEITVLQRARFFAGFKTKEYAERLIQRLRSGDYAGGSDSVRSLALAWCARVIGKDNRTFSSEQLADLARQLGYSPAVTVASACAAADKNDLDTALEILAQIRSPLTRSVAYILIARHQTKEAADTWLSSSGLSPADLDPDGKFVYLANALSRGHWEPAFDLTSTLDVADFAATPALLHAAAMAHLLQAVPIELRASVLNQIPLEPKTFPLSADNLGLHERRTAMELFSRCEAVARELGCEAAANAVSDYVLWLELRDPKIAPSALNRLRESLADPEHGLRRTPLALGFGVPVDIRTVEAEIERQIALAGGAPTQEVALARFALVLGQSDPTRVAEDIERNRQQLSSHIDTVTLRSIEIEALTRAGMRDRAAEVLEALSEEEVPAERLNDLKRMVHHFEDASHLETLKDRFEQSGQLPDLVNLVVAMEDAGDWESASTYGRLQFQRTRSVGDAERVARALQNANRLDELHTFLSEQRDLLDQSDNLRLMYAWSLYGIGALAKAHAELALLRAKGESSQTRNLEVSLLVTSGDWEPISSIVEREWSRKDEATARELMQLAQLAVSVDSPRAKDLVFAAAAKGRDDPNVLTTAYVTATNAGWEDDPSVAEWVSRAAQLSHEEGPVQTMSVADVLDLQPEWSRREQEIDKLFRSGGIPIFFAARALRKTLLQFFLVPAVANSTQSDVRKRSVIPAFSGKRQRQTPRDYSRIGLEPTSLLTMTLLGLGSELVRLCKQIVIPHSTLRWLFEERSKTAFHQPSRFRSAGELRSLIASGSLCAFKRTAGAIDRDLANDVGRELAELIAEASEGNRRQSGRQHLVVATAPVRSIRTPAMEPADVSAHSALLCSCVGVLEKVKQKGLVTAAEEKTARAFLSMHDRGWPSEPTIDDNAVLFLDDLAVTHLQYVGLLAKLQPAGLSAVVSSEKVIEANDLLTYEQLDAEVAATIERARRWLADGVRSGAIKLSKLRRAEDDEDSLSDHPTADAFKLPHVADLVVSDDRFLNEHTSITSGESTAALATSLDLLDVLRENRQISFDQWLDARTTLRRRGFVFIPVDLDELQHHLCQASTSDTKLVETAELRAIREALLLARMHGLLQLPSEVNWLNDFLKVVVEAIKSQWSDSVDDATARARSCWLLGLIDPRGWSGSMDHPPDADALNAGYASLLFQLIVLPASASGDSALRFSKWITDSVVDPLRQQEPRMFDLVLSQSKQLVRRVVSSRDRAGGGQ